MLLHPLQWGYSAWLWQIAQHLVSSFGEYFDLSWSVDREALFVW